ncbi:alpha/beta hydrolase [Rhodococcus sp. Z13]|uniref:Alpha/beta hydrolase n=1 Tax=Rhodococcus sacchari TaxID=2962047 RepID=A0ACD4DG01_9NOCA|nr:alpha/beta hydrolase [Rhodococcus sp. Z13]UYP18927.1 alpha/beta hydrolase [Rhodococcus sp. Z13]
MLTRSPYRCPGDDTVIHQACAGLLSHWKRPVEEHVARTSLGDTYVLTTGPTTAPPVVVLAGGDLPAAGLRLLADRFGDTNRVVLVDLPGLPGASAGSRPDARLHAVYGHWLTEILDALGADRVPVIGLGWAASVAAAVEDVERVEKLVLAAPLGLVPRIRWNRALIPSLQWRSEPNLENTERYLRALAGPGFEPDEQTLRWSCRVGAYCTSLINMPRIDRTLLKRWRGHSVEVVVGEKDPLVQVAALRKLTDEIGGRFVAVADAGHLLSVEAPELLVREIVDGVPQER